LKIAGHELKGVPFFWESSSQEKHWKFRLLQIPAMFIDKGQRGPDSPHFKTTSGSCLPQQGRTQLSKGSAGYLSLQLSRPSHPAKFSHYGLPFI